ncbi:MAG: TRAP transporter large permease subunit [Bdellovibrionales bacterium]|nr:TRAP transporter large permease subunit [Bdellovibrionales bacterium]
MHELFPLLIFLGTLAILLCGYPVAFSLAGSGLFFALIGTLTGDFDWVFLQALPERIYGIMVNETLLAIPLFVFMGVMLERSKISEDLLNTMAQLFGNLRGGLGISVCLVGGLLAASTGIVGATVVTMGLISLPSMLNHRYSPQLATGIICASGTLGQIIPPSIVLIILGDVMGSAHQQAQLAMGNFSPSSIGVGELFVGAILPGILLMLLYMVYILILAIVQPEAVPRLPEKDQRSFTDPQFLRKLVRVLLPPLALILGVLGSILAGVATPTEAASVGSVGAIFLAWVKKQLSLATLRDVLANTLSVNAMVFAILIGASVFSLTFRGFGGDHVVQNFLLNLGGGMVGSLLAVLGTMFLLGFFLDFFEITFVMVPLVGPSLLQMGMDPLWLGILIAVTLQTSFLTPPFGFSLFYLRGVAPDSVSTQDIYRGVVPFIIIQLLVLLILWFVPELATWLPQRVFS